MVCVTSSVERFLIASYDVGSVGQTVEDTPSLFCVYVSRDAGVTWYEVMKKRHLFNLADHGAMIVGVQMMFLHPVKKLV